VTSGFWSEGSIASRASRSQPFFVQRDDQLTGLVHLLSLGLRILTLIEFVVRRQLKAQGDSLVGLHLENLKGNNSTYDREVVEGI